MQSECATLYCSVRLYHIFPHYLINDTIFGEVIEHKMCVSIFSTTVSGTVLIPRRIQCDIIINVQTSLREVPLILSDFNENLIFTTDFLIIVKCQIS